MSAELTERTLDLQTPGRLGGALEVIRDRRVLIPLVMLLVAFLFAIAGPWLTPYGPAEMGTGAALLGFTPEHPLGTDQFGRDQLTRLADGARISLTVAALVTFFAIVVGSALGMVIGYAGGALDFIVGRFLDFMFAFPTVLLALCLATLLEPSLQTAAVTLAIIYVPISARFVRGLVLSERDREYVLSARVAGASVRRILMHHILPNITSPLLILATSIMSFTILAEASLSFLGVGAQPPTASWGKMLTDSQSYMSKDPLLVILPGFAISYLVLTLNLLGDGLRDQLDPRFRRHV